MIRTLLLGTALLLATPVFAAPSLQDATVGETVANLVISALDEKRT